MKRIFLTFSAFLFPWLALLLCGNPVGAVVAVVLQLTVFGWPFATLWALRAIRGEYRASKNH